MSDKTISHKDIRKMFDDLPKRAKRDYVAVAQEGMEYRSVYSDAARHIAEKIRQSTWGGAADFNVITLFERKKVWVMLDLETAEEFAAELEASGDKPGSKST